MASGKKSFILYTDLIHTVQTLTDVEAGQLFKHLLAYVNDQNPQTEDKIILIAFEPIKQQLKRDLKDWEEIREKRRLAGLASAEAKQQKSTSVNKSQQSPTKSTVNVTVTDTVNVNDIVKRKEEFIKEVHSHPTYSECFEGFIRYWVEPNKKKNKMRFELEKTWDTLGRLATWRSRNKNNGFTKPEPPKTRFNR